MTDAFHNLKTLGHTKKEKEGEKIRWMSCVSDSIAPKWLQHLLSYILLQCSFETLPIERQGLYPHPLKLNGLL